MKKLVASPGLSQQQADEYNKQLKMLDELGKLCKKKIKKLESKS